MFFICSYGGLFVAYAASRFFFCGSPETETISWTFDGNSANSYSFKHSWIMFLISKHQEFIILEVL